MTDLIDPPTRERRRTGAWIRGSLSPLLVRVHFWIGVLVGPFLILAAATGILYALTPQLERVVHAEQLIVSPAATTLPLTDQVELARRQIPTGELTEIRPAATATDTTRVSFGTPDTPAGRATTVFVDPHTGEVRGVLPTYGEWLPLRTWFDDLHRMLLLGDAGRLYSELAASWLWVLVVSGLVMWVARRRRRLRDLVVPQRTGSPRSRLRSRHAAVGVAASLGLVFLSITGLTWSQHAGAHIDQLRARFAWLAPSVATGLPGSSAVPPGPSGLQGTPGPTAERVALAARDAGLSGQLSIAPGEAGEAWTVTEVTRSWPVRADAIAVDPATGTVIDRVDFAAWPVMAKLARWGIDTHMGLLFGPVNQAVLIVLAAGLIAMISWGYRMWWRRVRNTSGSRWSPPTASGRYDPAAVGLVAAVGMVAAIALPVLGGSLLIILALEVGRSAVTRREPARRDARVREP